MEFRRWRGLAGAFLLFGGVGLVFLFGAGALGLHGETAARDWLAAARGPWALPAAVAAFAILAFLGVPQFVLIAAAVAAFGPWLGAVYSWIGTLGSALVGFWLGRALGPRVSRDLVGARLDRFGALIARNGFIASLIVRLVPFAPFVAVNMVAGVAGLSLLKFGGGTALGIVPKIALTSFVGGSIAVAWNGGGAGPLFLLAVAVTLWIALGLLARRWLRR